MENDKKLNSDLIIGHTKQRQRLEKLWRSNKVPSAMMFTGASGIGKSLVAKELSKTFFCEDGTTYGGCGKCRACHLFTAGNYPDFHVRDFLCKEDTTVEKLRELLYSLHLTPYAGKYRFILFHNVELISTQGANLLLKILEEPRPNVYFCLLSANPSRLPPTVLSRCHNWFFDKLSTSEIKEVIKQKDLASNLDHEELLLLADGTLENVTALEENFSLWESLQTSLKKIAAGDIALAGEMAYELNKDREALRLKLRMMSIYARSEMLKADANCLSWSICLTNLLNAESLIFERNIGANYLLSLILIDLAKQKDSTSSFLSQKGRLLHEVVV